MAIHKRKIRQTRGRPLVLVFTAFVLLLGIWQNISLSVSVSLWSDGMGMDEHMNNDAPQTSSTRRENEEKNRNNSASSTAAPFPRWNDPRGIQWEAIESYIRYADEHLTKGQALLECPNGGCPNDMPCVLYIFGARFHSTAMSVGANNNNNNNNNNETAENNPLSNNEPMVWVEGRRRKLVGRGFYNRYPIIEELMDRSLQYLLTNQLHIAAKKRYPRLLQTIAPDKNNNNNNNNHNHTLLLGIPLIMNFGDNRQCHFQNLLKKHSDNDQEERYNVPVFTLAVPTDCLFAFPIPHPAALDTASVYRNQWKSILDRRRRMYPLWNQTQQAVWRGSPTGWPMMEDENMNNSGWNMRQKMVYTANHLPQDNETLMRKLDMYQHQQPPLTLMLPPPNSSVNDDSTNTTVYSFLDVGFGKPFHKIVSSYKGPRIRGRSRLWFEDFAQYRVVLDADGSSWSERFGPLLCLNTVVAKLEPAFVDWLWPQVQANIHYVPIRKDSSNLWSAVLPFLIDEEEKDKNSTNHHRREQMIAKAQEWCVEHMTYDRMIQDFLGSLEQYVTWLDQGDQEWSTKWHRLLLHDMPPKHHHWQRLPVKPAGNYFPLWRDEGNEGSPNPRSD